MILKNLIRRRGRTLLTVLGISIGVAAIIGLGAFANSLEAGYTSMLTSSKADLVVSQPNAADISLSTVDEDIGDLIRVMPEVAAAEGMLQNFAATEGEPFIFVFGHPADSFALERFEVTEGAALDSREARQARGAPVLLGRAASEALDKTVGDTIRLAGGVFRVIGIYETGDAFEDGGAVLLLEDAQNLLGRPRQVSMFYIKLKDQALGDRLIARIERQLPDVSVSSGTDFAQGQLMIDTIRYTVWVIGGLAILLGGVGMMNAQLMAVYERTREIGVLRALGWGRRRILLMILGEALLVSLLGGLVGVLLGYGLLTAMENVTILFSGGAGNVSPDLLIQAFVVVLVLGFIGGLYPAYRASKLTPVEALRYEGGAAGGNVRRLPVGGMAVQSLVQRATRTLLTLTVISITVGAIMTLEAVVRSFSDSFNSLALGVDAQVMIRQADIADTSMSAIDERIGDKLDAMPEIENVSGMVFTAAMLPPTEGGGMGFFIVFGYEPRSLAMQRYKVVAGEPVATNHQVMIGRAMAESLSKDVGDTIELSGMRFRIVGVYESQVGWEEMGGVITLRDAQTMLGRPRKVTMFGLRLADPSQAQQVVDYINDQFPEAHAALAADFADQMPDMQSSQAMIDGISILAIVVGGVGVLNTMLMAVYERTREIGVLRSLGWGRRRILGLILREALLLGLLGGMLGIVIALGLSFLLTQIPLVGEMLTPDWTPTIFLRAISVALLLGLFGGFYPAFRATRLQPVEALRYE